MMLPACKTWVPAGGSIRLADSFTPSCSSNAAMRLLRVDCLTLSALAAREKLFVSAVATA